MKVTVFGTGYVGLVTGTCLAEVGHDVICVDVDAAKIDALNSGVIPIYEPGLDELVLNNTRLKRLRFTTDAQLAVAHGDVQFIAVGTPPDEDGSADLQYVLAVARTIATYMDGDKVIVDKSTVPVGTADKVTAAAAEVIGQRGVTFKFEVCSNPEFLKEGAAIDDFMKPDRIVVGTHSDNVRNLMSELYAPFNRSRERIVFMDVRSAELTKYAANAMLATKISFMNEMANLAERLGADIEAVREGIGSDPRIGYHFIYPGCGYGGSCFPKDVQALARTAAENGYEADILNAVEAVNTRQKSWLFTQLNKHFGGDLSGKKIALWGLSFKPKTDDMREAPSRVFMQQAWDAGASVSAYDPEAMEETSRIYGARDGLTLCESPSAALKDADALVICTEWNVFRGADLNQIKAALKTPVVVDGRNLYRPAQMKKMGFDYYSVGRLSI